MSDFDSEFCDGKGKGQGGGLPLQRWHRSERCQCGAQIGDIDCSDIWDGGTEREPMLVM
jgi:hypothetical protein